MRFSQLFSYLYCMKQKIQTVGEMVMRSHYLNALDIESKAETPLSDMERQDFINTINELRSTIESLRLTVNYPYSVR